MSLSDLAAFGNLIGGIAVLASLAYLALQVRQNTKHTRALIYTNRATRVQDFNLRMCHASDATLDSCLAGGRADSSMSEAQLLRYYSFCRAAFFDAQDTFRQYQEGLMSKDAYDGLMAIMKTRFSEPGMRAGWAVQRDTFSSDFRSLLDGLVQDCHDAPGAAARLKIAIAGEGSLSRRSDADISDRATFTELRSRAIAEMGRIQPLDTDTVCLYV